jgi:thiamine-phosphate pyrophosphorylase
MGRPYPDRFYPVVDTLDWVRRLVALGVGTVQLRAKDLGPAEALALVIDALAITRGQEDLVEADVPAIREAGLTLGLSTHDPDELDTALRHAPDYVALGPIYPTTLKAMRFGPQGLDRIGEWKRRIGTTPLVAIGGITLERGRGVFAAGADSIAVVSDVTQNSDPDRRVQAWLTLAES